MVRSSSLWVVLISAIGSFTASSATGGTPVPQTSDAKRIPTRQQLDAAREWLWANPPNAANVPARRERIALIQAAGDALLAKSFLDYLQCCKNDPDAADNMEQDGILRYLRKATDRAVEDVHKTKVNKGMAVWLVYNMGYVFKTPDTCFGIDLSLRNGQRLARDLDFLLISHEHGDHNCADLWLAMREARKPIVTRWRPKGYPDVAITTQPAEFRFGPARVKVDVGDHNWYLPDRLNNVLMFQVDCGPAANNVTIYHAGDGNNWSKMKPDRKVDLFIVSVADGMWIPRAIGHVKPKITLASHVLELTHHPTPPHLWRWSFNLAFNTIKSIPPEQAIVLTWGERWLAPGTALAE